MYLAVLLYYPGKKKLCVFRAWFIQGRKVYNWLKSAELLLRSGGAIAQPITDDVTSAEQNYTVSQKRTNFETV